MEEINFVYPCINASKYINFYTFEVDIFPNDEEMNSLRIQLVKECFDDYYCDRKNRKLKMSELLEKYIKKFDFANDLDEKINIDSFINTFRTIYIDCIIDIIIDTFELIYLHGIDYIGFYDIYYNGCHLYDITYMDNLDNIDERSIKVASLLRYWLNFEN